MELDGPGRDLEGGGDLVHGEVLDVEQRQTEALLAGQRGQQCADVGDVGLGLARRRLSGQALDGASLADVAAVLVAQPVDGHPPDPADRIVVPADRAPPQVGLHERVLHGVRGALVVAARHRQGAHQPCVMGPEERFEVIDHMCVGHTNNSHRSGHATGAPTVWLTANVQFETMPMGRLLTLPRADLALLPTPLERGPRLDAGPRLWVKRDDLTGLGVGGNKARKLEYLCGAALADGAECLITVGAGQSNHCRMTAAAGARLGLETHLVLSGDQPEELVGNQLLSHLFGAHQHFTGVPSANWGELEIAREALTEELEADGMRPHSIPIGGSTPVGALGYLAAFIETMEQCAALGIEPAAIAFTSSSGGTHAGLVAGLALWRSLGYADRLPEIVAIGVAKGVVLGLPDIVGLANAALALIDVSDLPSTPLVTAADVEIDTRWIGEDYAIPTAAADDAIVWSARNGGWVLDRTYSGKGMAGMLGNAAEGRWDAAADVVFIHTGGLPAVFAPGGVPDVAPAGEVHQQLL